jgi:ubiquinone/menaquinone biosynthesis C-methylase UbiE
MYADVLRRLQTRIANTPGTLIDTAFGPGHMLSMYQAQYDSQRALVGIDLPPSMVSLAQQRRGSRARVGFGDMRDLNEFQSGAAAAVINW